MFWYRSDWKGRDRDLVRAFLMLYLTDTLGIAAGFVGTLFFVARMWDAVNDPVMGMIVDNTKTKYGKFRIWLIVGTLLNSITFVLPFTTLGIDDMKTKCIYVSIMYILYGMTYTIMDVPYWSWLPNLSSDPRERRRYQSYQESLQVLAVSSSVLLD